MARSILRIRYTANGYDAFEPPTSTDIYVATVEIDTSVSNNYILSRTYNVQYLGKPSILDTGVPTYNATEQQYYIQFVNETDIGEIEITVPDEFKDTVKYADGEIRVTNAGKYWLNLNIRKTDGTVMWSTRDTEEKRLEFEVKQASMRLDIKSKRKREYRGNEGEKSASKHRQYAESLLRRRNQYGYSSGNEQSKHYTQNSVQQSANRQEYHVSAEHRFGDARLGGNRMGIGVRTVRKRQCQRKL